MSKENLNVTPTKTPISPELGTTSTADTDGKLCAESIEIFKTIEEITKQNQETVNEMKNLLARKDVEYQRTIDKLLCLQLDNHGNRNFTAEHQQTRQQDETETVLPPNQSNQRHRLRFDDIAASFKKFRGDKHISIYTWFQHFNEQSELFEFSQLEKFVYAKKLMVDTAKSFVEYECSAINYRQLENELIQEFGKSVNSALIHQKLQERKKKRDETSTQYLYEMMAIASQTNIDTAAIITYTINGLPGPNNIKAHMTRLE